MRISLRRIARVLKEEGRNHGIIVVIAAREFFEPPRSREFVEDMLFDLLYLLDNYKIRAL